MEYDLIALVIVTVLTTLTWVAVTKSVWFVVHHWREISTTDCCVSVGLLIVVFILGILSAVQLYNYANSILLDYEAQSKVVYAVV